MHSRFAETTKHPANQGEANHRFASGDLPFVVATESAITPQPTEGPLHDPAPRQSLEGVKLGALYNFDRAAPHLVRRLQQRSGAAAIGPDRFDTAASLLPEEGRPQWLGSIPVLNVRRQDQPPKNPPARVAQNVAFAPLIFLPAS